jgi:hypothetical protein
MNGELSMPILVAGGEEGLKQTCRQIDGSPMTVAPYIHVVWIISKQTHLVCIYMNINM